MKKKFSEFVEHTLSPKFDALGFRRKGQTFRRDLETGVIQFLSFNSYPKNKPDEFTFTGDLSFVRTSPRAKEDFLPDDPEAWILGLRMGIITHGLDHWYTMT